MNILLWMLQIILFIKFLATAYSHGVGQKQELMKQAIDKMGGKSKTVHLFTSILCAIGSFGILLPDVIRQYYMVVPISAVSLGVLTLASILFHVRYREKPVVIADIILFVLLMITGYGRLAINP